MPRDANFDLAGALASPSFTPGQKDAAALVELVVAGEEPAAQRAAIALGKLTDAGRKAIETRLAGGGPVGGDTAELGDASTMRLVAAIGLLARGGDAAARTALLERSRDAHVRVRRAAISALGKLTGADVVAALIARWDADDVTPDERRSLAEALGKVGGDDALTRLRALDPAQDAELARRRDRALLMANRDAKREADSAIATDVAPPNKMALAVVLRCRGGLASLLADELLHLGFAPKPHRDDEVAISLAKPWGTLQDSRLWVSAAIRYALPGGTDLVERITSVITSPAIRGLLSAWTRGPIRWRLGFANGRKRAVVWQVAKAVTARAPDLINDPTQTTWDFLVDDEAGTLDVVPRRAADPRFAWRVAEVAAASHPTVAAALARVAGARDGDRVWDPFVGSGSELVERARLGPCASLLGSDLDDAALAAARANLDAAGVRADLVNADARSHAPGPVDLIITNPPLGSRVQLDAAALLVAALPHFVQTLTRGGRLVWITPAIRKTTPVAEQLGLKRTRSFPVDLGGVRGQLERWDKP